MNAFNNGITEPTGDASVDALVALVAQTVNQPVGEHQELYASVLAGLERELNADPGTGREGAPS